MILNSKRHKLLKKKLTRKYRLFRKHLKNYHKFINKKQKRYHRQIKRIEKTFLKKQKLFKKQFRKRLKILLSIFTPVFFVNVYVFAAVALILMGMKVYINDQQANINTNTKIAKVIYDANHGNATPSVPSTIKPSISSIDNYSTPPYSPRYLIIPKLGVSSRVLSVGLDSTGAIQTPSNIFDTAWFNQSAKPGSPGATLIDGHVSSWTSQGVFYNLGNLNPGDAITVQRGDGSMIKYSVVKSQVYDVSNVDMVAALTSVDKSRSGLNLITCTGSIINGTNEFNKRLIIFAVKV